MPREEGPIEQRSTADLQRRFDFITQNSRVVREAIECMFILQELDRREQAAVEMAQQRAAAMRADFQKAQAEPIHLKAGEDFQATILPTTPANEGMDGNTGGPDGAAG